MSATDDHTEWPIAEFAASLRRAGVRVGPAEYEQALYVLALRPSWPRDALRNTLAGLFLPGLSEIVVFNAVFDRSFTGADIAPLARKLEKESSTAGPPSAFAEQVTPPPPNGEPADRFVQPPPPEREGPEQSDPPPPFWRRLLRAFTPVDGLGRTLLTLVGLLVICVALALISLVQGGSALGVGGGPKGPNPASAQDAPPIAWAYSAAVGAGLLGAILMALRWLTRERPAAASAVPASDAGPVASPRTSYRVGFVGGAPPPRIEPERLPRIVDLFAYAEGVEDPRDLDADGTIEATIAAAGMMMVRHPKSRILPTIIILEDATSRARLWNTTAQELEAPLASRGFDVVRRSFPGTLHGSFIPGRGRRRSALAHELDSLVEQAFYSVVIVFSDASLWNDDDTALLRRLASNGHAFWFDERDRELWDARLDTFRLAGIPIYEATGAGIEEALRAAFAPGRGVGTRATTAGAALRRRTGTTPEDEAHALLGDAIGWARDCALLEPISAALAESIRQRFHADLPWIAFSRLVALPGSTIAAEGLRFSSRIRAMLLTEFAELEPSSRREPVIAHIVKAIESESPGAGDPTAAATWRLAIQRVHVFRDPDDAVRSIDEIRRSGLLDPEPIDEFLRRLHPLANRAMAPSFRTGEDAIALPAPIHRAETMDILTAKRPATLIVPRPVWRISAPELRLDAAAYGWPPVASFVDESTLALTARDAGDRSRSIALIDVSSGVNRASLGPIEGTVRAADGRDGMLALATSSRVVAFQLGPNRDKSRGDDTAREAARPIDLDLPVRANSPLVLRVAPERGEVFMADGGQLHRASLGGNRGTLIAGDRGTPIGDRGTLIGDDQRTRSVAISDVTCLADLPDGRLACGTRDGTIVLAFADANDGMVRLPRPLTGPVEALAVDARSDGSVVVAAAYGDGTGSFYIAGLRVPASTRSSADTGEAWKPIAVRFQPRRLEIADGPIVLVVGDEAIDIVDPAAGLSLLATGSRDLLQSLGTNGARVAAASLAARLIATASDAPARFEVRRLQYRRADETRSAASQSEGPPPAEVSPGTAAMA